VPFLLAERARFQRRSSLVKREASELRNEIRFTRPASREPMALRAVKDSSDPPLRASEWNKIRQP
jgi:hypothetical protein